MVEPQTVERLPAVAIKVGIVLCNVASFVSLVMSLAHRQPTVPSMASAPVVSVSLLAVLLALTYSMLWSIADHRIFRWNFGGGENFTMPTGWSAVVLSLSVTLPLTFVPYLYQRMSHDTVIILPNHWWAMGAVAVLAAVGHLIMYGTKNNGIRQRLSPAGEYPSATIAFVLESLYALVYFATVVLPYRLIVRPSAPLGDLLWARTLIPGLAFFLVMALFITFMYPDSLHDRAWVLARGLVSGFVMMFCFSAGMFM